ncbi:MAG: polyprenyl diphosphate synthase [Desulfotomaculales bacterium]
MPARPFSRLPAHLGIIPDGNRRWAQRQGLPKEAGYAKGVEAGAEFFKVCLELGLKEITFYGFTQDNTKRPPVQVRAFQQACVEAVRRLATQDCVLRVIGNTRSPLFPRELLPFTTRRVFGRGLVRVNFLVNYGWLWDLSHAVDNHRAGGARRAGLLKAIASADVSRVDLIIRWGGRRRLSGFLPLQSVYADLYVIDDLWPDFRPEHVYEALRWYETQDVTLGG